MFRIKYSFFSATLLVLLTGSVLANSSWPIYQQAAALFKSGAAPAKVRQLCRNVLDNSKDEVLKARTRFLLAYSYAREKNFLKARKTLSDIQRQTALPAGLRDAAKLRQARLFRRTGENLAAIQLLDNVAREGANLFTVKEARLGLAEIFSDDGNWRRADSLLNLVQEGKIGSSPNEERIVVLQALKSLSEAQPEIAVGLLQGRGGEHALFVLARAYRLAGKVVQAAQAYKQIGEAYPAQAERAMFAAGEVFSGAGDWSAAADQFGRLLQAFPRGEFSQAANFRHGLSLLKSGLPEAALTALQQGDRNDGELNFVYMKAECLRILAREKPEAGRKAIALYRKVAALQPDSRLGKTSVLRIASLLVEADRRDDGVITLRQYLALHPKDPSSNAVSFLLAQIVPSEDAALYFNRVLEKDGGGSVREASLVNLQNRDYVAGRYLEVVSRAGQYMEQTQAGSASYWRRVNYLLLAESSYFLRNYEIAARNYERASAAAEDEIAAKAALGRSWVWVQQGELERAAKTFEWLRQSLAGENRTRALFGLATTHFRLRNFEQAIDEYQLLAKNNLSGQQDSLRVRVLYRLAESDARLDYTQDAIDTWQEIVDRFPDSHFAPAAEFEIAEIYFRTNHFEKAKAVLDDFLSEYSEHALAPVCALRRSQCDFNAGHFEGAISGFHEFLLAYPSHESAGDALAGLQNSYFRLGRQEEAVGTLLELVRQYPESILSAEARLLIGKNYVELKNYVEVRRIYKEVVVNYPGSSYAVDAQLALAQSYYDSGNDSAAVAEFTQFLTYFPESEQADEAFFELGISYFNLEEYGKATNNFSRILDGYPKSRFHGPALQNMAWCYDKLGESEQAIQFFQRYLTQAAAGDDADRVRLETARLLVLQGQSRESLKILQSVRENAAGEIAAEADYRLGLAYLDLQRRDDARRVFEQAVQRGKQDGYYRLSAISQLAALYEGEKQWDKAMAMYQLLIQTTSEKTWTTAALERIDAIADLLGDTAE